MSRCKTSGAREASQCLLGARAPWQCHNQSRRPILTHIRHQKCTNQRAGEGLSLEFNLKIVIEIVIIIEAIEQPAILLIARGLGGIVA